MINKVINTKIVSTICLNTNLIQQISLESVKDCYKYRLNGRTILIVPNKTNHPTGTI